MSVLPDLQVIKYARETINVRGCEIKRAMILVSTEFDRNSENEKLSFANRVIYALDDNSDTGTYLQSGDFSLNVDMTKEQIMNLKKEYTVLKTFFEDQIVIHKDAEYSLEEYLDIYQTEAKESFKRRLEFEWIIPYDITMYFPYKSEVIIDNSIYFTKIAKIANDPTGAAMMVFEVQALNFDGVSYALETVIFKYPVSSYTDDEGAIDLIKMPVFHASDAEKEAALDSGKRWFDYTKNYHIVRVNGMLEYKAATNSYMDGVSNSVGINGNGVIDYAAVKSNFIRLGYQPYKYNSGYQLIDADSINAYLKYHSRKIPLFYKGVQMCGYVDLNSIEAPEFDTDLLNKVIIPDDFKVKIANSLHGDSADIVGQKGSTKLFVLAGPTGLGKTLTATAFAESRRKMLIYVSAGTLGSEPSNIEKSLDAFMELASRWKADMLLDEGDVYVSERNDNDLVRNQIVAIFLTHLEKYNIVMYLTTNRSNSIDSAIMSRVSLFLRYKKMSFTDFVKIIKLSCDKIKMDMPSNGELKYLAARFVIKNVFSKRKVNGRRINKITEGVYGDIKSGDKRSFKDLFIERMKYSE